MPRPVWLCDESIRSLAIREGITAPQPEWLPVLAQALGADPPPPAETLPPPETPEMSGRGASNARAKRELGWRPRYASWREGFAAGIT